MLYKKKSIKGLKSFDEKPGMMAHSNIVKEVFDIFEGIFRSTLDGFWACFD